jgi:hypothetical protein
VFVGLADASEFKLLPHLDNPHNALCLPNSTVVKISGKIAVANSTGAFTTTVARDGPYWAVLHICDISFARLEVVASFRNPISLLSADVQPCLVLRPVVLCTMLLLAGAWVVNWLLHFTMHNPMHSVLTATFAVGVAHLFADELELMHKHVSDDPTPLEWIDLALDLLARIGLLGTLLIAARGWSIVVASIRWCDIFSSFACAVAVVVPLVAVQRLPISTFTCVAMVIVMGAIAVYCQRMISGIARATSFLMAHLLVISRNGIDATTTPVYKKFTLFRILTVSMLVYFAVVSLMLIVTQVVSPGYWMVELVDSAVLLFIVSAAMWAFKLTSFRSTDYLMVQLATNCRSTELLRSEINGLGPHSELLRVGLDAWQEGMALPGQPVLLDDGDGMTENRARAPKRHKDSAR